LTKQETQNEEKTIFGNHFEHIEKTSTGLKDLKKETEKDAITKMLKTFNGDCQKTADYLGISIRTLYYKMKKYQIKKQYYFQSDTK